MFVRRAISTVLYLMVNTFLETCFLLIKIQHVKSRGGDLILQQDAAEHQTVKSGKRAYTGGCHNSTS
jgi:hypothetical protein